MNDTVDVDWNAGCLTTEALGIIFHKFPSRFGVELKKNETQTGRYFCDSSGIPRKGDVVKIGHVTAKVPDMYEFLVGCVEHGDLSSLDDYGY